MNFHFAASFLPGWHKMLAQILLLAGLLVSTSCEEPGLTKGFTNNYPRSLGLMMSQEWEDLGLTGKGIKVGVIDEGFNGLRTDELTRGVQVEAYRNFINNDTTDFFRKGPAHGARVVRNLGGRNGNEVWGLAHQAQYYLAISENPDGERRVEERNLNRAIAWMLEQNVRVINISLGYLDFDDGPDYGPDDLYKARTVSGRYIDSVTRANPQVNFVVSIGNDGFKNPPLLSTPADVQYVITVTSTDADGSSKTANASEGLSNAPYIKPDVGTYPNIAGTSFAAPAIAGLVAAMLEKKPSLTNREVLDLLHQSGSLATSPNYKMGYGVPSTAKLVPLIQ